MVIYANKREWSQSIVNEYGGGYETRVEKGTAGDWLRVVVCMRFDQKLAIVTAVN